MPSPGVTYTLAEPDAVIPVNHAFGWNDRISSVPERMGTVKALVTDAFSTMAFALAAFDVPPTPRNTVTFPELMRR